MLIAQLQLTLRTKRPPNHEDYRSSFCLSKVRPILFLLQKATSHKCLFCSGTLLKLHTVTIMLFLVIPKSYSISEERGLGKVVSASKVANFKHLAESQHVITADGTNSLNNQDLYVQLMASNRLPQKDQHHCASDCITPRLSMTFFHYTAE